MINSARYLKGHPQSNGRLGAVGFCWGGGMVNHLAVTLGDELAAGVPFYGATPAAADMPRVRTPLLIHYAEDDERINAMWPAYQAALEASAAPCGPPFYPGTRHGFHNNSTPRYDEAAAKLAWERTLAFFGGRLR